jgi:hypothetical protein
MAARDDVKRAPEIARNHRPTSAKYADGHREKEKFLVKLRRRLAAIFNDLEIEKFDLVALRHGFGALEVACPMKKRLPALDMSGNAPQVAMANATKDGRNPAKVQAVGCHNQIQKRYPD